jgi:hypothetical protein
MNAVEVSLSTDAMDGYLVSHLLDGIVVNLGRLFARDRSDAEHSRVGLRQCDVDFLTGVCPQMRGCGSNENREPAVWFESPWGFEPRLVSAPETRPAQLRPKKG